MGARTRKSGSGDDSKKVCYIKKGMKGMGRVEKSWKMGGGKPCEP